MEYKFSLNLDRYVVVARDYLTGKDIKKVSLMNVANEIDQNLALMKLLVTSVTVNGVESSGFDFDDLPTDVLGGFMKAHEENKKKVISYESKESQGLEFQGTTRAE